MKLAETFRWVAQAANETENDPDYNIVMARLRLAASNGDFSIGVSVFFFTNATMNRLRNEGFTVETVTEDGHPLYKVSF